MDLTISPVARHHRDQLAALVNLHVGAVLPGRRLSTNVVLAQLEREPTETVVDPWVRDRRALVALAGETVVAAVLLHRFADRAEVASDYRGAAATRWLVCHPDHPRAGQALVGAARSWARSLAASHLLLDPALPAPGCYGLPDSWPHLRQLWDEAGVRGPERLEQVVVATCADLVTSTAFEADRSVGTLGTRLGVARETGERLGWIEVCDPGAADLACSGSLLGGHRQPLAR